MEGLRRKGERYWRKTKKVVRKGKEGGKEGTKKRREERQQVKKIKSDEESNVINLLRARRKSILDSNEPLKRLDFINH